MNKQVLIEKLNMTYSFIDILISKIQEKDMSESIVQGKRTPKDIIAHIAAWNWSGIEWVESIAAGVKPHLPMEGHNLEDRDNVFAHLNEVIHNRYQDRILKDVLDDHYKSWATLMKLVETLKQEDLDRVFHLDWSSNPISGWNVVAWRVWHAENHAKQLESWLDAK